MADLPHLASTWFFAAQPVAKPVAILYALGHAGSGAGIWTPAASCLPADVEMRAVRLPGRETRASELPLLDVAQQADELFEALCALHSGTPYALAGVCSGAITMFELARRLGRTANPASLLIVACQAAPSRLARYQGERLHAQDGTRLRLLLGERGDLPDFIARDEELFETFEPILRADFEASESYVYQAGPRLRCPVVAITADQDEFLSHEDIRSWAKFTTGGFSLARCPGRHNLLLDQAEGLAACIAGALREHGLTTPRAGAE